MRYVAHNFASFGPGKVGKRSVFMLTITALGTNDGETFAFFLPLSLWNVLKRPSATLGEVYGQTVLWRHLLLKIYSDFLHSHFDDCVFSFFTQRVFHKITCNTVIRKCNVGIKLNLRSP